MKLLIFTAGVLTGIVIGWATNQPEADIVGERLVGR